MILLIHEDEYNVICYCIFFTIFSSLGCRFSTSRVTDTRTSRVKLCQRSCHWMETKRTRCWTGNSRVWGHRLCCKYAHVQFSKRILISTCDSRFDMGGNKIIVGKWPRGVHVWLVEHRGFHNQHVLCYVDLSEDFVCLHSLGMSCIISTNRVSKIKTILFRSWLRTNLKTITITIDRNKTLGFCVTIHIYFLKSFSVRACSWCYCQKIYVNCALLLPIILNWQSAHSIVP